MSFRDRASQPPDWDADEDGAPPVWQDGSATEQPIGAQTVESAELPSWSFNLGDDDRSSDATYSPPPPRTRRTVPAGQGQRGAAWPNLRDSLRGSSTGATAGTRPGARSYSYPPTSSGRYETTDPVPGDRLDDDHTWSQLDDGSIAVPEDTAYVEPRYPVRRRSTTRSRPRARRAGPAAARPQFQVPAAVAAIAASQDRAVLGAIGISLFSLLMMVATVTSRSDTLPDWIVTHLNAAGNPDGWSTSSAIWRVPLMTAMLTLGSLIGALFVGRRDPFAARFLVAAALLVHLLAWVGLVRLLW